MFVWLITAKDYGLFLPGEAYGSGAWLEPGKTLDYYLLRNGDTIEYRRKMRTLKVRTLDGTNKTLLVDDSQNVANLMVVICTKMGITNHDEYSLVRELPEENDTLGRPENYGTLTLRRKREEKERDAKMEQLRKKLKTDDEGMYFEKSVYLGKYSIAPNTVSIIFMFFIIFQSIGLTTQKPCANRVLKKMRFCCYVESISSLTRTLTPTTRCN